MRPLTCRSTRAAARAQHATRAPHGSLCALLPGCLVQRAKCVHIPLLCTAGGELALVDETVTPLSSQVIVRRT